MMRYNFHPDARAEYLEAISFYNGRQSGLGTAFTLEFESAIGRILEAPTRWRIIEKDVRRCLVRKFPYGVLYTIEANSVLIVAVMHFRRKPGYWFDRLPTGVISNGENQK